MHPWRERLSRWFTPLARSIPLSPNSISILAFVVNVAGAVALALGARVPSLFFLAAALITVGGLLDALDGIVARVQNRETPFGDFLDHLLDRASDAAVIGGWMIGTSVRLPIALATISAVLLNGYIGTQIEATFHQRSYEGAGRGEFVLALVCFPLFAFSLAAAEQLFVRHGGLTSPEWMTVAIAAVAAIGLVQRFRMAARLSRKS